MPAELHATVSARLRAVEQRYTPRRRALVALLFDAARPLSIPEILARDARLPQSSVYRNLGVLADAGAVSRVMAADEFVRFELAEDLTEHHHHLVCTACGTVADFRVSPALEQSLGRAIASVVDATGFEPHSHRLDLVGRCAACVGS